MSALSIFKPDRQTVVGIANPIFLTSLLKMVRGAEVTFEVLDRDGAGLKILIGTKQLYYLDGRLFWADLKSLEPCQSIHPGLTLLRHKPTLRGVFLMLGEHSEA
jgi:hypothetical protein